MQPTRAQAQRLDDEDALAPLRAAFVSPPCLYLDGHSLGPPTRRALARLDRTARENWSKRLVLAWNDDGDGGWIDLPARVGSKIARLIGVAAEEVAVTDSVSVNLFKLAAALLEQGKSIAVPDGEFPTDGYVMEGLARLTGAPLTRLAPGAPLAERKIGVLIKSAVDYRTAAAADMAQTEAAAGAAGAAIIWDLSHATGVLALDLARDGVRFAVGCGYKYLNGGPGAPSFLYCKGSEAARLNNPLSGWFGHAAPFDFAPDYRAAAGAKRFMSGTPPILSLAALDAALDVFDGVDMRAVQAKAQRLCAVFRDRVAASGINVEIAHAADLPRHGAHVGLRHKDGYAIIRCLIERGVMGDFRAPDLMRFGFSPLFLRHVDAFDAAEALIAVVSTRAHSAPRFAIREKVT